MVDHQGLTVYDLAMMMLEKCSDAIKAFFSQALIWWLPGFDVPGSNTDSGWLLMLPAVMNETKSEQTYNVHQVPAMPAGIRVQRSITKNKGRRSR